MGILIITLIATVVFSIFILRYYKKNNIKVSKLFIVGLYLFTIYLAMVFDVTGPGNISDIGVNSEFNISLIPFQYTAGDKMGLILNAFMFMPLGVLLPLLWRTYENFFNTIIVGFCFSLAIELFQLLNFRATDIDDLIMNTLGAAIGYCIYFVLFRKLFRHIKINNTVRKYQAGFIIVAMFLLNFFLAPVSNWVLYGFLF